MQSLTESGIFRAAQSHVILGKNYVNDAFDSHPYWILFHLVALSLGFLWVLNTAFPIALPDKVPAPVGGSIAKMANASANATHQIADTPQLDPPKSDPISVSDLKFYDGQVEGEKIYVAIKGTVFDVSAKPQMYGKGAGYNVFAGKDASRALGMSSLKPEDAVADYSTLTEEEMGVLEDWLKYFTKRYNIVGKVVP